MELTHVNVPQADSPIARHKREGEEEEMQRRKEKGNPLGSHKKVVSTMKECPLMGSPPLL